MFWVSLRQFVVTPLAGNDRGHSPGPLVSPHPDFSPFGANVVSGLALVVLTMILRSASVTTIRELGKGRFVTYRTWRRVPGTPEASQWDGG